MHVFLRLAFIFSDVTLISVPSLPTSRLLPSSGALHHGLCDNDCLLLSHSLRTLRRHVPSSGMIFYLWKAISFYHFPVN